MKSNAKLLGISLYIFLIGIEVLVNCSEYVWFYKPKRRLIITIGTKYTISAGIIIKISYLDMCDSDLWVGAVSLPTAGAGIPLKLK